LIYGVLHLGGWDFHCCVQPFPGARRYEEIQSRLFGRLAHRAEAAIALQAEFGREYFNLTHLFPAERHRIMRLLTQSTLNQLDQIYRQVYQANYRVLLGYRQDGLPVPESLQAAASIVLNQRLMTCLRDMELEGIGRDWVLELRAIATEARELGCNLKLEEATALIDRLVQRQLWQLVHAFDAAQLLHRLQQLNQWLTIAQELGLPVAGDRAQELYLSCIEEHIAPQYPQILEQPEPKFTPESLGTLLTLGQRLQVDVGKWLAAMHRGT
jgi:alpha-amylase/alpha-mannosidase (GH57 family)